MRVQVVGQLAADVLVYFQLVKVQHKFRHYLKIDELVFVVCSKFKII